MHVSESKIKANRENASHSTGPVTPEGKAKAAANALEFGLATESVIPQESREAYDEFFEQIFADFHLEGISATEIFSHKMALARVREDNCAAAEVRLMEIVAAEDENRELPPNGTLADRTARSYLKRLGFEKALNLFNRYRKDAEREYRQCHAAVMTMMKHFRKIDRENIQDQIAAQIAVLNTPLPKIDFSQRGTKPNQTQNSTPQRT